MAPNPLGGSTLWWTYFFGAMWGFGGLTFGLTMRYLGMSLGMGVALGYCAAFGTLIPPIFKTFIPTIPVAGMALILGIDRFLSMFRALVNMIGNGVATLVLARWEGELTSQALQENLVRQQSGV